MARFLIVFVAFFLAGCVERGPEITDHTTRSTVYGWVDVGDIQGNRMTNFQIRQYAPVTDFPYYGAYYQKFAGGYVFAKNGLPNGSFKLDRLDLMTCLAVLCTNTINQYDFGRQGAGPGAFSISRPGAHFVGNFKLNTADKGGMFRQGTFDFDRVSGGPTRKQILEFLLENAESEFEIYNQRMKSAYNRL